jgi:hypothetical protein
LKITVLLDVTPCSLVEIYNVSEEPAASIFMLESLMTFQQATGRHIPEDLHIYRCKKLNHQEILYGEWERFEKEPAVVAI